MSGAATSIEELAAAKEILISTGSGGVGKTTTAAALGAMAAAELGLKVLVLTVDPARRLATALGLEEFGNIEARVPDDAFVEAGVTPRGEMWAAMLDTKKSWDELVDRHAPDVATRDAILANAIYQNFSSRFVQSHDYVAMERLYDIHSSGNYDLIVVDTPPTRNAVDFLDAPERMADFFSSRLLRWLTAPARSRVVSMASRPFYTVADRILGTQFLQDIAEFFLLFQTMYDGFVERARAVDALIASDATAFVVVSTLEAAPAREAEFFIDLLETRHLSLGAVVLNRVLPSSLLERDAATAAKRLVDEPDSIAAALVVADPDFAHSVDLLPAVLSRVGENYLDFAVVAKRESEKRAGLSRRSPRVAAVPFFDHDIADIAGLLALGESLWR